MVLRGCSCGDAMAHRVLLGRLARLLPEHSCHPAASLDGTGLADWPLKVLGAFADVIVDARERRPEVHDERRGRVTRRGRVARSRATRSPRQAKACAHVPTMSSTEAT